MKRKNRSQTNPKRRMEQSPLVFAAASAKKLAQEVLIEGVDLPPKMMVIQPPFKGVSIDETYQRLVITNKVNELKHVLLNGGVIPDPVSLAERDDKSLFVVDGQQRYWAHLDCNKPMLALVYRVHSYSAEADLFYVFNNRRNLKPDSIIKSSQRASGELIRRYNTDTRSPVRGMIQFENNGSRPLTATVLARSFLCLLAGTQPSGNVGSYVLPRLDSALSAPYAREWCDAFVSLMAAVFQPTAGSRVHVLPAVALAQVAHEKYTAAGRPVFPSSCYALKRANWDSMVPSPSFRFLPTMRAEVLQRWK